MTNKTKTILMYLPIVIFNIIMGFFIKYVFILLLFSFGDKSDRLFALLFAAGYFALLAVGNFLLYKLSSKFINLDLGKYLKCSILSFILYSALIGIIASTVMWIVMAFFR